MEQLSLRPLVHRPLRRLSCAVWPTGLRRPDCLEQVITAFGTALDSEASGTDWPTMQCRL